MSLLVVIVLVNFVDEIQFELDLFFCIFDKMVENGVLLVLYENVIFLFILIMLYVK